MIQSNELIALSIATGVLAFIFSLRKELNGIANFRCLILGFICMYIGLVLTVAEGFIFENAFNILEHLFNLASTVFLVAWIWKSSSSKRGSLWPL